MIENLKIDDLRYVKENKNTICVWYMNIECEKMWTDDNQVILNISNQDNTKIVNRTEQLCLMLARENDVVIQREFPPEIVLKHIKNIGITSTNIWTIDESINDETKIISELILCDTKLIERLKVLRSENLDSEIVLIPYAVSWIDEEIAKVTGCRLYSSSSQITSWINSKINSRKLAEELEMQVPLGYVCYSRKEIRESIYKMFYELNINKIVVKQEYGASGKGFYIIDSEDSYKMYLHLLQRKKNKDKKINVIVEKWYETLMDINYQIFIDCDGKIRYIQPKKQLIKNGIYNGSMFIQNDELKESEKKFLESAALKVGNKLAEIGYRGLASIDCIMDYDENIYPIIEINGRFSLSTYVSFLEERYVKGKVVKFKYYNIININDIDNLIKKLDDYQYIEKIGEGIVIYSLALNNNGLYKGRIFILFINNTHDGLVELENTIEKLLT